MSGSGLVSTVHARWGAVEVAHPATVASRRQADSLALPAEPEMLEADGGAHSFCTNDSAGRAWHVVSVICVSGYDREGRLSLNELSKGTLVDVFS